MAVVRTGDIVGRAAHDGRAALAFNVVTLEHVESVVTGAQDSGQPVVLQVSQNAVRFHGGVLRPLAAAALEVARTATVDVALHLDHVDDDQLLRQAADAGFSSVMFDAGARSYHDNIAATRAAVELGHAAGLWVEAELGFVGGKPDTPVSAHAAGARTDPDEARDFVRRTGVDALAVAVGSSHAMTSRSAVLDHDLIGRLQKKAGVPLVLHGSSGVPDEELRRAVSAGVVKVNIGTALGIAFTAEVRRVLDGDPNVVDPRVYLAPARDAMTTTVRTLFAALG